MGISLEIFSVSVQIVGVFLDVLGEAERVVAHECLGPLRIAPLERLDDRHMVADRAIGPVLLADGLPADHAHMREQILGQRYEHAVAAHADDGLVKLDVHLGVLVQLGVQPAVLEFREHAAQSGDLLCARVLRDQARRHTFQRGPGRDHLDHLAPGLANDIYPAPGNGAHEAFALELRHGLTHRRATDAEIERQAPLVEPDILAAAIDVHRDDGIPERSIGAALEALRAADGLDRDARRHFRLDGGRPGVGRDPGRTGGTIITHDWYTIFQKYNRAQSRISSSADDRGYA